jgi:hypothetical protein
MANASNEQQQITRTFLASIDPQSKQNAPGSDKGEKDVRQFFVDERDR